MYKLREERGGRRGRGREGRRQRAERAEKAGEQGGWEKAGRSHLLCPLASHSGPGLRTLLRSGSCTLRLRDARGHLGLGGSCCHNILRLHPASLGESLPGLGRLGPGGRPLPGRGCLGAPGGNTGALCGSLLGRGRSLGAWEGHATDTCRLAEIKGVVLTQEGCLGPGGIHLTCTRGLGKAQAVLGPSAAASWAWEDVCGCGDLAGAPGAAISLLTSIRELCGEATLVSGVAAGAWAADVMGWVSPPDAWCVATGWWLVTT